MPLVNAYVNGALTQVEAPPPPTLAEARTFVAQLIRNWKAQEEVKNITALGTEWETTPAARARLLETIAVGDNPSGVWTDAFDVDQPVTFVQLRNAFTAIRNRDADIRARVRAMKNAASTMTVEELLAFTPSWV